MPAITRRSRIVVRLFLFTRPGCSGCDALRAQVLKFLEQHDVEFTEYDVTTAVGMGNASYFDLGDTPLPVLVVENRHGHRKFSTFPTELDLARA